MSDTINDQSEHDEASAAPPATDAPHEFRIHLNLRVGPEKSTRRANSALTVPTTWTFALEDGLHTLRAQVEQRIRRFNGYVLPADNNILLQPTISATQGQLQVLTPENYVELMIRAHRRLHSRSTASQGTTKLEIWVYLNSRNSNSRNTNNTGGATI